MGYEVNIEPLELKLEKDVLKALIILEAMEDTMIHLYEDILSQLREPLKKHNKGST